MKSELSFKNPIMDVKQVKVIKGKTMSNLLNVKQC